MLKKIIRGEEGFAIVGAIIMTAVLSLGAAVLMSRTTDEASKAENTVERVQSLYTAEMGVAYAKNILRSWDNWYTWGDVPPTGTQQVVTLPNGETATFSIDFAYNMDGSTLTASGTYAGETRSLQLTVDTQYDPIFVKALCACGGDDEHFEDDDGDHHDDNDHEKGAFIANWDHDDDHGHGHGGGFTTDSYNSLLGAYATQAHGAMGDIGSMNDIWLGGATINGNAEAGTNLRGGCDHDGDHDHEHGGPGLINGDVFTGGTASNVTIAGALTQGYSFEKPPCDCNTDLPFAVANAETDNNNAAIPNWAWKDNDPNSYELEMENMETITLPSGLYYMEELELKDNAKINIAGEVIIFLFGESELELKGNAMLNSDSNAANLRIYSYNHDDHDHDGHGGDEGEIEIKDNASLAAAVYAPNAKIEIKDNAQIYGAIAGGTIKIEDSPDVHYDEHIRDKLGDVPTDGVAMIVQLWHEL